jgi:hypothetical protein
MDIHSLGGHRLLASRNPLGSVFGYSRHTGTLARIALFNTGRVWIAFEWMSGNLEPSVYHLGRQRILVRMRSTPDKYEQSAAILRSFPKEHPAILQIDFERQGKAMRLALR